MKRYIRGGFMVRGKYIRASYDVPDEPTTCEEILKGAEEENADVEEYATLYAYGLSNEDLVDTVRICDPNKVSDKDCKKVCKAVQNEALFRMG